MTPAWIISTQKMCKPVKDIQWECPSISPPPKPTWEVLQSFFSLPFYWLACFHQVSCIHKLLSRGGDGKQKWIVIFIPCAILQNLFPIHCISRGRRGEHCFANGVTLLNSVTEALQNKKTTVRYLWLWLQLLNSLPRFIVRLFHDNKISNVFIKKFLNTLYKP